MRLWKIAAFAILVLSVGHLIYIFYEAEPSEITPYEEKPIRHVMLEADYFPILCDILIIVIIFTGLARGVRRRKTPKFPEEENWLILMFMRIGVLAFLGFMYVLFLRRGLKNRGAFNVFQAFQNLTNPKSGVELVPVEPTPFEQYLVVLLSLIIIFVIVTLLITMFKPSKHSEPPVLVALPEILMRKKEFTFDGNPRDVVINAYGATLLALYKKGIPIPEHFTPWEFQKKVGNSHLQRLTQLFEKARYSTHEVSPKDSEEAVKKYRLLKEEEFDIPSLPEA